MDSLLLLCARHIITQCPLPALPPHLYHTVFQVAFLDGKDMVLQDLVVTWPFPELHFQQLVGHRELLPDRTCTDCVQAVVQGVVTQLQLVLKEPGRHYSLRVLDMTGLPDSVSGHALTGFGNWSTTRALASACVEMSEHQQELQRRGSKRKKGQSRDTAVLQPLGVDIHADLVVDKWSYEILRKALQAAATGPLRLKCRVFKAEDILASEIVTLLVSLDRSCVQSVDLCLRNLGWIGLLEILPHLLRFKELRSLKLQYSNVDVQRPTPESAIGIGRLTLPEEILSSLQGLRKAASQLSRNLHQIRCFHAPALKRLDLSGFDVSKGLLELFQLLLEKTSSSLLSLDLRDCLMADSHLAALLPTLLRCSRLRFLGLHGNSLSTVVLKDLLQKILELPDLHLVVFPFPVNCYKPARLESDFDFVTDEELLAAATAEFSQILVNSGRTDLVWTYNPHGHDAVDFFSL